MACTSCSDTCPHPTLTGKKINDAAAIDKMGLDRKRLARLAVESYLQQILRYGFFHADPHPGNVAVDDGYEGGRIIYYDFGMMGSIVPGVRGGLLELFYGVYNKDAERWVAGWRVWRGGVARWRYGDLQSVSESLHHTLGRPCIPCVVSAPQLYWLSCGTCH
jgi:hypothetical protein